MHSVELYRKLGDDCGWVECGGLRLASSEERLEELRRQAGWANTFGLPLELVDAERAAELFPLMSTEGVLGAAWLPSDGWLDPQLTYALAEGARQGGGRGSSPLHPGHGHRHPAWPGHAGAHRPRRRRDRGGGDSCSMFWPNSGGWRACAFPWCRCRTSTRSQPFREHDPEHPLPTLRDPDLLVYFREDGGGLVMGGYERLPPAFLDGGGDGAGFDRIPPDFNGRLLEDDWDRFEEIVVNSRRRVPHGGREVTRTSTVPRPSRRTTSSASARPRSVA